MKVIRLLLPAALCALAAGPTRAQTADFAALAQYDGADREQRLAKAAKGERELTLFRLLNETLGGSLAGRPDTMAGPFGDLQVYAPSADGTLRHWVFNFSSGWIVSNETLGPI